MVNFLHVYTYTVFDLEFLKYLQPKDDLPNAKGSPPFSCYRHSELGGREAASVANKNHEVYKQYTAIECLEISCLPDRKTVPSANSAVDGTILGTANKCITCSFLRLHLLTLVRK